MTAGPCCARRTHRNRQRSTQMIDTPDRATETACAAATAATTHARGAHLACAAAAARADADAFDPARPFRNGHRATVGYDRDFAPGGPFGKPKTAIAAIHAQCLMPLAAIAADLQTQVVIAGQA